jgi:hypothetical protein
MVYTGFLATGGCLGIAAGVAVLSRRPWAGVVILGWAAAAFVCVILSPLVWRWPGIIPTLGAFAMVLILTVLTYRGWQATASSQTD